MKAQLLPDVLQFILFSSLIITLIPLYAAKLSSFLQDLHRINELQLFATQYGESIFKLKLFVLSPEKIIAVHEITFSSRCVILQSTEFSAA